MAVNFGPRQLFCNIKSSSVSCSTVKKITGPVLFETSSEGCHPEIEVTDGGTRVSKRANTSSHWVNVRLTPVLRLGSEPFSVRFNIDRIGGCHYIAFGVLPASHPPLEGISGCRPGEGNVGLEAGVSLSGNGDRHCNGRTLNAAEARLYDGNTVLVRVDRSSGGVGPAGSVEFKVNGEYTGAPIPLEFTEDAVVVVSLYFYMEGVQIISLLPS
eukprot:RCo050146